jgi:hypothetical protein
MARTWVDAAEWLKWHAFFDPGRMTGRRCQPRWSIVELRPAA